MVTLYKGDKECTCSVEQMAELVAAGWSRTKPKAKPKAKAKAGS